MFGSFRCRIATGFMFGTVYAICTTLFNGGGHRIFMNARSSWVQGQLNYLLGTVALEAHERFHPSLILIRSAAGLGRLYSFSLELCLCVYPVLVHLWQWPRPCLPDVGTSQPSAGIQTPRKKKGETDAPSSTDLKHKRRKLATPNLISDFETSARNHAKKLLRRRERWQEKRVAAAKHPDDGSDSSSSSSSSENNPESSWEWKTTSLHPVLANLYTPHVLLFVYSVYIYIFK